MSGLKTQWLWMAVGLSVALSGPICLGGEIAGAEATPAAASVVAHFHLSGALTESPVVDPFGLTVGQVMSLSGLVDRLDQAGHDDEVKAVVLTFDFFPREASKSTAWNNASQPASV